MSKQISIVNTAARARLAVRREPYWCVLRKGLAVGYRRLSEGEGTWIARQRDESTGPQQYQSLGHVETFEEAATRWTACWKHFARFRKTQVSPVRHV